MQLRPYQKEASDAVWDSLRAGRSPCVLLPTGTGKSLCIADLVHRIRDRGGCVWVLVHVKELVEQNRRTLDRYAGLEDVGTICAGLNETDEGASVTFATVQSLAGRVSRGAITRTPDAVIIDEAHRVPLAEAGKLYNGILGQYKAIPRIGFTATPWRMDNGLIYGDQEGVWFNDLCYQKSVPEMVELGFLCPLVGVETEIQLDLSGIEKSGGDYVQKQVGEKQTSPWLAAVVTSVQSLAAKRNHVAVYCPTVEAAHLTAEAFEAGGWSSAVVVGATKDRTEVIGGWKTGAKRVLCSVDVLTTGFDHPPLDCIVCLRPTESSSLWVQVMGRGTRIHEGKNNCLVLDYVGNLARLGGIGMMEDFVVEKAGKVESTRKATGRGPKKEQKKPERLNAVDPMAGKAGNITVYVNDADYMVIGSKSQPGKQMVMVSYECQTEEGYLITVNDFVMPEYTGWARAKSEAWVRARGGYSLPYDAVSAQHLCYSLPIPRRMTIKRNGKYWNVVAEVM